LHDEIHKMNSLLHRRKVISPSILTVFHNGKQEKFTYHVHNNNKEILIMSYNTPGKPDGLNIMLTKQKGISDLIK
jgi:hypothetical protein